MAIDSAALSSRRALLAGSLGALAALAAQALGRPLGARASADSITHTNDTNNQDVLTARSIANGPGTGQGIGVHGHSDRSVGVRGTSDTNAGVRGDSETGYGMWAESQQNHALVTFSESNIGVWGQSDSGIGVRGAAAHGRGGVFKGSKAAIRLRPTGANSHPATGQVGDTVVDNSGRLWFCQRGAAWRRLS